MENLIGIVSAKLNALKLMLVTDGDIPQNVNFAIRASIVTSFMDANGTAYATGNAAQSMQPADLPYASESRRLFELIVAA